jgi:hypothetical protein
MPGRDSITTPELFISRGMFFPGLFNRTSLALAFNRHAEPYLCIVEVLSAVATRVPENNFRNCSYYKKTSPWPGILPYTNKKVGQDPHFQRPKLSKTAAQCKHYFPLKPLGEPVSRE